MGVRRKSTRYVVQDGKSIRWTSSREAKAMYARRAHKRRYFKDPEYRLMRLRYARQNRLNPKHAATRAAWAKAYYAKPSVKRKERARAKAWYWKNKEAANLRQRLRYAIKRKRRLAENGILDPMHKRLYIRTSCRQSPAR